MAAQKNAFAKAISIEQYQEEVGCPDQPRQQQGGEFRTDCTRAEIRAAPQFEKI